MTVPDCYFNHSENGSPKGLSFHYSIVLCGRKASPYIQKYQSWHTCRRRFFIWYPSNPRLICRFRYYAIACALVLSLLNWILVGLFDDVLDLFYLESWQVFLTCIVIFCGLSNVFSAVFQYRLNSETIANALIRNFKWIFFFFFFFAACHGTWQLRCEFFILSVNDLSNEVSFHPLDAHI